MIDGNNCKDCLYRKKIETKDIKEVLYCAYSDQLVHSYDDIGDCSCWEKDVKTEK